MIPTVFGAPRILRTLNVASVGLSLAAATAAIFGALSPEFSGLVVGVPTLAVGALWAWVLRLPNTIARSRVRWGWLASIPLAALNAALAGGAFFAVNESGSPLEKAAMGAILGSTFGAFFWGPALVLTLLFFGVPIAWSQHLARRGLAGEERGEWMVGGVCTLLAAAALALAFLQPPGHRADLAASVAYGLVFTKIVAALGILTGATATGLAQAREARRRTFVKRAEAGEIKGFRVDPSPEGKVLVRVSSQGEGYRVADFAEEVFLLDEQGRATEARALELPR